MRTGLTVRPSFGQLRSRGDQISEEQRAVVCVRDSGPDCQYNFGGLAALLCDPRSGRIKAIDNRQVERNDRAGCSIFSRPLQKGEPETSLIP
jgi:hypothetical protein